MELRPAASTPPPVPHWPQRLVSRVEARERAQTALVLLFPGPPRRDPTRFSNALIGTVASGLGGRFFDELRDKQSLCYTVHAVATERQLMGTFTAYIATSPEQEDAARDGLLAEFRRFREEEVTAEELDRAKTYAIGSHAIRQQSGGAVLADIVDAWLFSDLRNLEEFDANIRRVTGESMQRAAVMYFDPSRRAEGIVRGR